MALGRVERILILAKTYPSPSAQYVETSCVAGIAQGGAMRRLFPVPFRMVEDGQQFKKWQWIDVRVEQLRKAPFDFHYRYVCDTPDGEKEHKHKIVDWEAGALFWNCRRDHGIDWEAPFRAKLEGQLGGKDLMFLMGNQHRFQDQWLIISLIYPPKRTPVDDRQMSLL
jgi:hypothetical protein